MMISLQAAPPITVTMNPTSGNCVDGDVVTLSATSATLNLAYSWTVAGAAVTGTPVTSGGNTVGSNYVYQCATAGSARIGTTAKGQYTDTSTAVGNTVTVTNPAPVFGTTQFPATAVIGQTVALVVPFIDDSKTSSAYTLQVTWEPATQTKAAVIATVTTTGRSYFTASYSYMAAGRYYVELLLTELSTPPLTITTTSLIEIGLAVSTAAD